LTAPLVAWAPCGSDVGPRGMPRDLLERGPLGWARDHVAPRLAGKGFTHCCIAYPGGSEPDGSDLRFDMVSRAAQYDDDVRVQACGDYPVWADAALIIKQIVGCKVGFYLGTSHALSRPLALHECEDIIFHWQGFADFICIDTLAARPAGHNDHACANRLAAAGFEVWAEPRPVRGFPLYPTVHLCIDTTWQKHNSSFGNAEHSARNEFEAHGASVVLIDTTSVNKETVQLARAGGIGYAVPPSFVPVVGNVGGPV